MSAGPGSVEDEARRLGEALQRCRSSAHQDPDCGDSGASGEAGREAPPSMGHLLDAARGHGPEMLRSLADAASLVAEGLRVVADAVEGPPTSSGDGRERRGDEDTPGAGDAARYGSSGGPGR